MSVFMTVFTAYVSGKVPWFKLVVMQALRWPSPPKRWV